MKKATGRATLKEAASNLSLFQDVLFSAIFSRHKLKSFLSNWNLLFSFARNVM
jgi:hypothetical protein